MCTNQYKVNSLKTHRVKIIEKFFILNGNGKEGARI